MEKNVWLIRQSTPDGFADHGLVIYQQHKNMVFLNTGSIVSVRCSSRVHL